MGGPATFAGTTYQANVTALVFSHVLSGAPLGWLGTTDAPTAVAPEVGGVGDDIWIECDGAALRFEAQVKHGLHGKAELRELLAALAQEPTQTLVLVVDSTASLPIRHHLRHDLIRLRSGRVDNLRESTRTWIEETPGGLDTLKRLFIVEVNVDTGDQGGKRQAIANLRNCLEKPEETEAAWSILVDDASRATATRLRRNRPDLVARLRESSIVVEPPSPNNRWHGRLDTTKRLSEEFESEAVLAGLRHLEADIGTGPAEPRVRYRIAVQRANALLHLGRFSESLLSAKQALDYEPNGIEGFLNACSASLGLRNIPEAEAFASLATQRHPTDHRAWSLLARVSRSKGAELPNIPPNISEAPAYRTTLAQLALDEHDYERAAKLTAVLLSEGLRSAPILYVHASASLFLVTMRGGDNKSSYQDIDRWSAEALDSISSEKHPLVPLILGVRAEAFRRLGQDKDAAADVERLRALDPDDVNGLFQAARTLMADEDYNRAHATLLRPVVERQPDLLALRAQIASHLGRDAEARQDLETGERRLGDATEQVMSRVQLAAAGIQLGDLVYAERVLKGVPKDAALSAPVLVLNGRLSWKKSDYLQAIDQYGAALQTDASLHIDVLQEIASLALQTGQAEAAVQFFDRHPPNQPLPPGMRAMLGKALLDSGKLDRVRAIVEEERASGHIGDWALSLAIELAIRVEDTEEQVTLLEELVRREQATIKGRLFLVGSMLELSREDKARDQLEVILADPAASPLERMQAASFLRQLGDHGRAIDVAFAAYRLSPNDYRIARAFVTITLMSRSTPRETPVVEASTHVTLESDSGQREEHTIYADEPIDPQRGERSIADATELGILGKRVGDEIERTAAGWTTRWKVTSVVAAEVFAVNDAADNYSQRFPQAPFFLAKVPVGDGESVRDFAPMVASLSQRKRHVESMLAIYEEHGMPLGMMAKAIGTSIPEVMARAESPPLDRPLFVEWSVPQDQRDVRQHLASAQSLVLTRSAVHTASGLDLLEILSNSLRLIAPRALRSELEGELRDAENHLRHGRSTLAVGTGGFSVEEVEAGSRSLQAARDAIAAQREWLLSHCTLMPRPLAVVATETAEELEMREVLSPSAYDAVRLAMQMESVLYADDLGLRKLEIAGQRPRSCSTITLLAALCERGVIESHTRDANLIRLIQRKYVWVLPTPELIGLALREAGTLGQSTVMRVLTTLAAGHLALDESVDVLIETMRGLATTQVIVTGVYETMVRCLPVMALKWPAQTVVAAVRQVCDKRLTFLPQAHAECLRACREFLATQSAQNQPRT